MPMTMSTSSRTDWPMPCHVSCVYTTVSELPEIHTLLCILNTLSPIFPLSPLSFHADNDNRVYLTPLPGVSGSDYINASFIDVRKATVPPLSCIITQWQGRGFIVLVHDG